MHTDFRFRSAATVSVGVNSIRRIVVPVVVLLLSSCADQARVERAPLMPEDHGLIVTWDPWQVRTWYQLTPDGDHMPVTTATMNVLIPDQLNLNGDLKVQGLVLWLGVILAAGVTCALVDTTLHQFRDSEAILVVEDPQQHGRFALRPGVNMVSLHPDLRARAAAAEGLPAVFLRVGRWASSEPVRLHLYEGQLIPTEARSCSAASVP